MASKRAETAKSATVHTLPAIHAVHLAQLVERWQVSGRELLEELGLSESELSAPGAKMALSDSQRLIERARALTGEPGLGFYLGLQMRISAHGYVGFAAMAASTLREALELASRFSPTRTTVLGLRVETSGDTATLVVEEHCALGSARDVILFSLVVGLWRIGDSITGHQLKGDADFAFAEPDYTPRFRALAPGKLRFSQPMNRLVFPARYLDLPLMLSDPGALRLAREQCERELDALGYDTNMAARVRQLLRKRSSRPGEFPSLEDIAAEIHTSPRTLKRKLADHATSYSELLDEARCSKAIELLQSDLSVDEIADRLGYSDAANFTRAFRRWTGKTPKAFRRG